MSIRCFIAIELDDAVRGELAQLQERLRRKPFMDERSIRWVDPKLVHLTLKFLGDVEDNVVMDICQAVSDVADEFRPFEFEIGDVGCFPPRGAGRVLWVGVKDGLELLRPLHEAVDSAMEQLDFPCERRQYSAHLTLARIKNAKIGHIVRETVDAFEPVSLGLQSVCKITVFQSKLTGSGPVYTAMHTAELAGG